MKYIADIKEGEHVREHYLCVNKQILKTRAGKSYYSLKLQDKTGIADGKVWDLSDGIGNFEEGDYIKVDALAISFQGSIQLNIRRIRKLQEGEYDPKEYIPVSDHNIDDMFDELKIIINTIDNKYLKALLTDFFIEDVEFAKQFKAHTAAKTMHHNFYGGLLEHTLGVVTTCEFFSQQYDMIDRDLLLTAAMLHDIGKIKELSAFPMINYTDEGQLLGHIVMTVEWIGKRAEKITGFPEELENLLKHCILAHHGQLEYGSPKTPMIIEALALHYADNSDAKLKAFMSLLNGASTEDTWVGYQRIFESNIRRTR